MKLIILFISLCSIFPAAAQKYPLFKGIDFDSSYQIIGLGRGYGRPIDSLGRFWFILDNPADMQQLQRDWVFQGSVASLQIEEPAIDIYVIRNRQPIANFALIFPKQRIININGSWHPFDTSWLVRLHAAHPLNYSSEEKSFDTYPQFAAYGNGLLRDSGVLYFLAPSLRFEGSFTLIARRSKDPASPMFVLRDLSDNMKFLSPSGGYRVGYPERDSFNITRIDSVKMTVDCSRRLYEKYHDKHMIKGAWEPAKIDATVFWRRDP
jgi:hypothetical protein